MLRLFAVAGFLAFAGSAQAITPAPLPQPDGMITQVRMTDGGSGAQMRQGTGVRHIVAIPLVTVTCCRQ